MSFLATESRLNTRPVDWFKCNLELSLSAELQIWVEPCNVQKFSPSGKVCFLGPYGLYPSSFAAFNPSVRWCKKSDTIIIFSSDELSEARQMPKTLYYWNWYEALKIGSWQKSIFNVWNEFAMF